MYSPTQGRFISRDPIGVAGGDNEDEYAKNDPINWDDPSGLAPRPVNTPMSDSGVGTSQGWATARAKALLQMPINSGRDAMSVYSQATQLISDSLTEMSAETDAITPADRFTPTAVHAAGWNETVSIAVDAAGRALSLMGAGMVDTSSQFATTNDRDKWVTTQLSAVETGRWKAHQLEVLAKFGGPGILIAASMQGFNGQMAHPNFGFVPGEFSAITAVEEGVVGNGAAVQPETLVRAESVGATPNGVIATGESNVITSGPSVAGSPTQSTLLRRYLSETGGRWGSAATRALDNELATDLEGHGYTIAGGAGRASEEWIPGPAGRKGGTFVDITATNGTGAVRIQTVTTLADGVTLTPAEQAAAARIRAAFPNDELRLVPKR